MDDYLVEFGGDEEDLVVFEEGAVDFVVCGYVGGVGVGFAHVEDAGDVFEGFDEFLHFFGGGFVAACVAPVAVGVLFAEFDVEGAYEAAYLVEAR